MSDILKCYVSGRHLVDRGKRGIMSFAVPEYGILFRCYAEGSRADLEIIAFLSFLRFAEHNIEIFKKKDLQIFTDFPVLAYIINNDSGYGRKLESVRREARKIAKRIRFKVKLVDTKNNRAAGSAIDIPDMPIGSDLKIKTFANLAVKKTDDSHRDGLKI